jgi:hypothetical protein
MNNGFGPYKPESEHAIRQPEVKRDAAVEALVKLYHGTKGTDPGSDNNGCANISGIISPPLKNHGYSAKDIENFSIALAEFQEDDGFNSFAGLLLSVLVNNGKEVDYVIHTAHLSVPIWYLGYENTKNITVKGNVGGAIGRNMQGGTITVEGNAGCQAGEHMRSGTLIVRGNADNQAGFGMTGGTLIVQGNAGYQVGWSMGGGEIIVKGNAGNAVGHAMDGGVITVVGNAGDDIGEYSMGGEIHFEGRIGSIYEYTRCKIFHPGKLIPIPPQV